MTRGLTSRTLHSVTMMMIIKCKTRRIASFPKTCSKGFNMLSLLLPVQKESWSCSRSSPKLVFQHDEAKGGSVEGKGEKLHQLDPNQQLAIINSSDHFPVFCILNSQIKRTNTMLSSRFLSLSQGKFYTWHQPTWLVTNSPSLKNFLSKSSRCNPSNLLWTNML